MGPTGHLVTIKRSGVDGPHFPLSLRTCLFGRGIECDIRIQLPVVSKQHCKIEINEQKAILFNLSSTNPTQVNGSAIDEPVRLKHGDVITIVDRSFRYENEAHQNGSTSTEFPGQRCDQSDLFDPPAPQISGTASFTGIPPTSHRSDSEGVREPTDQKAGLWVQYVVSVVSPRRVAMSGFNPDGKVQDPKTCSKPTEESVSGRRLVHAGEVRAAQPISRASREPVARETPSVHPVDLPGDDSRKAAGAAAGDAKGVSRAMALLGNGELKPFPSTQCLENSEENESPFRKLYESMKEELDMRSEKEMVLRSRRKSGSRSHGAAESESADGLQGETPRLVSPKSRQTSGQTTPSKADPSAYRAQGSGQMEKGTDEGPVQISKVTVSPGVPRKKTGIPRRRSQQGATPKGQSGDLCVIKGDAPANLDESGGFKADSGTLLPGKSLPRNQTPTKLENADNFGNTPGKVSSKKRRRSSVSANVDILTIETEIQTQTALGPLHLQVEKKMPDGALSTSEPLCTPAGQRGPGSPGLRPVDVRNIGDSTNNTEGMPLKRRRVSFGGHLRPELFDENLPPNTPLKRGETPTRRRSLGTHTATTVLKKIIKEQSQPSGKEDPSSETHLGVTAQNVCLSSPAHNPMRTPAANEDRQRSSESSSASSGRVSPPQRETPKRGGRRSSSGPAKSMSVDRTQQEILQRIQSKRRSGASEANLIVAKSWADIVKLSAKQTQTKVIKHGPRRQLNKRQRRVNTPKKPTATVHNQLSTGHANSPCTIVVGKAHIEKVSVPARPYRMLNNFMFNKKIDFNEDLSGLTEMFKTPAKEKPQVMRLCPITFSNSEDFPRKRLKGLKSEEKPLPCTPENFGDSVFPSTKNAPEQMSDKSSTSPALRQHRFPVNENRETLPSEAESPKVASSIKKFRRSMELRNIQVPGSDCENKDTEAYTTENILEKPLRKTQQDEKLKEEMKESEGTFETCKKNTESKQNSEKMIAVKRSRRSLELKCAQRADLITPKRLQETEPNEDLGLLQTSDHGKEPVDVENRTAAMHRKSPQPDPGSTPARMNIRLKTPSRNVNVGELSALGRSTQTPGETTHSHRESVGDGKIIEFFKETPEQKLDSAEFVTGSRRRSRTPKRKVQSLEDLAGFKELFQTPNCTVELVTNDKATKIPHKSPKPEPVNSPGGDNDIRAFKETPEQKLDPAENITGSKKRRRTPKRKVQPLEDLAGLKDLFQTPNNTVGPVTDDRTTKIFCQSPQPEAVIISTSMIRQLKTPPQKVAGKEELSVLRKSTQTPGGTKGSLREAVGDDKIIEFIKETPEQKQDSAENVTGSRRRSRTPKRKVQSLEDLAGFKELFQTPNRTVELVTDDKATKIPFKSPKPEPVNSPGGDNDIRAFKDTPEQKLDPAENITGSRKRRRTPKRKVQPLEDLAGLKELFQTPNHTVGPVTDDRTIKIFCQSPQPEPVISIMTRQLKTPPRKVAGEEELSALRKSTRTPGGSKGLPREVVGDDKTIEFFKETPEQKLDSVENGTINRWRSRTPKRKIQSLEDLTGFKELFQTPSHTVEPVVDDKTTKITYKSPEPDPGSTRARMNIRIKTPSRKVNVGELSALGRSTQTPGKTTHSHRESVGDDEIIEFFKETPEQKLDSAENITGSRRRSRTPKRKVQSLEDLAGFKELFQTPNRTVELVTYDKATKIPHRSPKPEPVNSPGGANDIRAFKETPEQKLDPAENITGSRKRRRTPKRKVQSLEDLAGLKELFQTPNNTVAPVTDDRTTKIFCQSPQPEAVIISTSMIRQLKTPPQKVAGKEELSALRKSTQTPGGTKGSLREAVGDDKIIEFLKETPEQKQDSAENVTGSRRRSRTPKRKVQSLEDLAGFKELFQTPNRTVELVTDDKATKIPLKSLKPEPVNSPGGASDIRAFKETPEQKLDRTENVTGSKRRSRTPKRKAQPLEDLVGFKELFQTPNHTRESVTDDKATKIPLKSPKPEPVNSPGGDNDIRAFKDTPEQKLDPAENITGSRKRRRTPKRKVQPLEDLTGFKELFQTPNHTRESVTDDKATIIPHKSPKPVPVNTPTSTKHHLQTPLGKVNREEDVSALRKPTQTPGETTHSHGEPVGDAKDISALMATPEENLDSAENVTGSRKRPRTPKRKVQPLEDLAGLKELSQTPNHTGEPVTDDKTRISCKSPQAEAGMPTGSRSCLRAHPGKADIDVEPSALRKPTRASRKTTHSHREPEDDKVITVFKESAVQKLDPAEKVTRRMRKPRTAKEKTQHLEDLTSLKEIFQAPDHTAETVTVVKTTKMRCQSPGPGILPSSKKRRLKAPSGKVDVDVEPSALRKPTRASRKTMRSHREPEDDKVITVFKESAVQKLDPAKNVTRSMRKPRTAKEKTQPLEDVAGLKEIFQVPDHTGEPVTDDKTRISCKSPQAEAGMPTGSRSCLRAHPGKADIDVEPSALRKPTRASRKTTRSHREPEDDDKVITVFKESAVQKLDPAEKVTRSMRKPRTAKEKTQHLEDLAGLKETFQAPDHTGEPVTVVKTTKMRCQSPGPGILPSSKKRRLKAPSGKADTDVEPSALRKSVRTGRSTRAHREPEDDDADIACEGTAKPKPGPAENTTGIKRLLRTHKEKAPPLEGPAGCQELLQTADPDKDQGNDAESVKRTPMQTPERGEPVKTSRRGLRATRVKPMDGLTGSSNAVKSQSKSSVSQSSQRKRGKDGTGPGEKRLRSRPCPQATAPETPLQRRQGPAPRKRCELPDPLITKKKSQRVLAGRTEPVEDLRSNSVRTEKARKAESATSPAKGRSLRSRNPNKTSGAEPSPELLESAEKIKVKKKEKKALNTSREVKLQNLEAGAQNSASGDQVREKSLRSRRQGTKPLPGATEEKAQEKSAAATHMKKKIQEEKAGSQCSGSVGLRSRKKTVPPTGDSVEKESEQKVTRSAKRSAENIKKEDDNVCIKKLRTRRHRGNEDI